MPAAVRTLSSLRYMRPHQLHALPRAWHVHRPCSVYQVCMFSTHARRGEHPLDHHRRRVRATIDGIDPSVTSLCAEIHVFVHLGQKTQYMYLIQSTNVAHSDRSDDHRTHALRLSRYCTNVNTCTTEIRTRQLSVFSTNKLVCLSDSLRHGRWLHEWKVHGERAPPPAYVFV